MSTRLVLVVGAGRLASAIARRLRAAGVEVQRSVGAGGMDVADDGEAFSTAVLAGADALVLAADDDAGNVDLALSARRLRPGLRLVLRVFDPQLGDYVRATLPGVVVLSMSAVAAPAFAEQTLRALERAPSPAARLSRKGPRQPGIVAAFARRLDRVVLGALFGLAAVVAIATLYFARALSLRPIDALYFVWTTVMTVGYGDISLKDAPDGVKLVGMALMLAGAASMAVLFAFFTGWVVTRRLAVHEGRVRVGGRGHVVIVGAGNVGTRVSALLAKAGRRVVLVERDSQCRNLGALRADGHHVILADAVSGPVLALAGVTRAAALLALTESDTTNLHVAFVARAHVPDLPVIMRAESTELPNHVTEQKDAVALSPIAIAAEAFTLAILDRGEVR